MPNSTKKQTEVIDITWDDTKVANDDFPSAEYNDMVTDQKSRAKPNSENKRGSDCSGSDGAVSRILTLANTDTTKSGAFGVYINGNRVHSADITVSHLSASSTITFSIKVWDTDYIAVDYFT